MLILAFALLATGAPRTTSAFQGRDTTAEQVTGIVRDSLGKPVPSATVIVTRGPDRFVVNTTTDSAGVFSARFEPGTGDYLIHVSSPTLGTVRRRVRRGDPGITDPVMLVLRGSAPTLRRVLVEAARPRPPRGQTSESDPGNASTTLEGLGEWLGAARPGSMIHQLASVPGVLSVDGGLTVAGLANQAHQVTLNGSEVEAGALPALARSRVRLATSTVDPAQGGFSGVQVAVEMIPGSNIAHREYSTNIVPPAPFADNAVDAWMTRHAREEASVNAAADGALVYDRLYYSMAGQATVSRQRMSLDPRTAAGTISRLDDALAMLLGAPLRVGMADDRAFALSGVARIDRTPRGAHAVQVTALGRVSHGSSYGDAPSTIGRTLTIDEYGGVLQGSHATYFGGTLNELRGALAFNASTTRPRVELPEGSVMLDTGVDTGSVGTLLFGGTGSGPATRQRLSAELVNETSRYVHGTTHRVKSAAGVRVVGERRYALANALGRFIYQDLAALEANRPSSFIISPPPQEASVSLGSAFLALSDNWRLAPTVRLLYGIRMDLRESPAFPAPGIDADRPQTEYVTDMSPRVGFTWAYRAPSRIEPPIRAGAMGTFSARPHGILRGSVGRYVGAQNMEALIRAETDARANQWQVRCLGVAVPTPDWAGMMDGSAPRPASCESAGSLIDSGTTAYHTSRGLAGVDSWRATLGWSGAMRALWLGVDATWSWTRRMMTLTPDGSPRAAQFLSQPDQRPVQVPLEAIDPVSGLLIPTFGASTRTLAYTHAERGTGRGAQITLSVSPLSANVSRRHWSLAYTLARSSVAALGIDYPGAAGPPTGEMVPAPFDVRHTLVGQIGIVTRSGYSVVAVSRAQSGTPFTPIASGDLDGDGVTGDRAFVPRMLAGEGSIGESVQRVLASTTGAGRSCIRRSGGTIAGINSCRSPRTFNATLLLRTPPGVNRHLPFSERVTVTAYADNVVSLADRLVNGPRLAGWGSNADLDPVLVRVTGFDPATKSFAYRPNTAFARPRGRGSPYRVGFTVSVDLSQSGNAQSLQRFLSPGRGRNPGPRLSADTITARFGRTVIDVYDMVLEESDSLLLRRDQADSLAAWQPEYRRMVAALWSTLGRDLAALDHRYDAEAVLARTDSVTDSAWAAAQLHAQRIFRVLDPMQQALVPGLLRTLATADQPVRIRVTTPW